MTKIYTIYGNCQARVVSSFLNSSESFKNQYQYLAINPVHILNKNELDEFIDDVLPKIDLFIYQPISDNFRNEKRYSSNYLLQQLKPESKSISFPSCYFKGYNPEIKYLKNESNASITDQFDYHDQNVIKGFLESLSIEEIKKNLNNENYYSPEVSLTAVENSLEELAQRENDIFGTGKQIDVKITKFIRDNYQKKRLFYTINHPSKFVLKYIAEETLELLGIKDTIKLERDFLSHTAYPIYQSHYQNLKLSFSNPMQYKIRDCDYDLNTGIKNYLDYYASLPKKILEINVP